MMATNTVFTPKLSTRDNKRHMQFLSTSWYWSDFRSLVREVQAKFHVS